MTDGVFDSGGNFHPLPGIDSDKATIIFRERVFAMMKENNRLSDGLMEKMRNWRHSGFSVHGEVVIQKENREVLVRLAQYVAHASFSAEKICYVKKTGCVMYKSKLYQGKKRNFEIMDAIEFLHRVCFHIPEHYETLIRYYGYYANVARWEEKEIGVGKSTVA